MDRPYLALEHPIRMAHRGSRALWPENTMVAFGEAIDLGYRYVETDVRVTLDGVVVAFHDAELDRTTNAMGKISDWLWEDLRHLDAGWSYGAAVGYPHRGNGVGIPRLDEVLATWPDVHFNIDLKASGIEWAVADVITRARRRTSTMIGSFHDRRIAKFRRITRGEVATSAGPATVARAWAASRAGRSLPGSVDAYQVPAGHAAASGSIASSWPPLTQQGARFTPGPSTRPSTWSSFSTSASTASSPIGPTR